MNCCRLWLWICYGLWASDIWMTFSTLHIFCCKIFSRPRLPKMTLNLFWSLHTNHLLTTLLHLLFSCNSLYSTLSSYFHFHFLRYQLCCHSSTFTFNLLIILKGDVLPQPTKHLQCSLQFACLQFYTLRPHFQVPMMVWSSQVSNMLANIICIGSLHKLQASLVQYAFASK